MLLLTEFSVASNFTAFGLLCLFFTFFPIEIVFLVSAKWRGEYQNSSLVDLQLNT